MLRPPFLIAILSLCAGEMQGRATSGEDPRADRERETSRPRATRRVAFRTDSPRLFAPAATRPAAPQKALIRPERERPRSLAPAPASRAASPTPVTSAVPRDLALQPTTFTPYDPYLGSVRAVIAHLDGRRATMVTACELVREGRRFRYLITDPYRAQPPAVTEARQAGDCKSKALWLYDQLGDPGAFYVIGKLERRSRTSHAWVYWRCDGRWWILDPTDRGTPISAESVASHRYVPYYSYSRAGTFRHPATSLMLAMGNGIPAAPDTAAVAVRSRSGGAQTSRR